MLMLWPPYRRRVCAEADRLMEHFGDQARNAASRLFRVAQRAHDYRKANFYRRVDNYLRRYIDEDTQIAANIEAREQERYVADGEHAAMFDRLMSDRTLH